MTGSETSASAGSVGVGNCSKLDGEDEVMRAPKLLSGKSANLVPDYFGAEGAGVGGNAGQEQRTIGRKDLEDKGMARCRRGGRECGY